MTMLPVASPSEVRAHARRLALRHPGELALALGLHAAAAAAGLAGPWLIGGLVGDLETGVDDADRVVLAIAAFVLLQSVLLVVAWRVSARLGEKVLALLREDFVDSVLRLPVSTVERAGTGDLVVRTTRDVDVLSNAVRLAVPDAVISLTAVLLTLGALVAVGPLLMLPGLVAVPVLWAATRWYLRRTRPGYLRANATYSQLVNGLNETTVGARTVETFGLADTRLGRLDGDIAESYAAERYTLRLRSIYLPLADTGYILPAAAILLAGGLLYLDGLASLPAVTAAVLYAQQVIEPLDRLLFWLDELQVAGAGMARILGVARADDTPIPAAAAAATPALDTPAPAAVALEGVSFAYRAGQLAVDGVDLTVSQGERLAVVGRSGAGKSTLGRIIAGIHAPVEGTVEVGGRDVRLLALPELRREVALVTQENHVFRGALRDNLLLARPQATDAELRRALDVVGARSWVEELGLDSRVGSGGAALSPDRVQQLALARIVLADPHTLILDEATSAFDPRAARAVERSLAAVLEGRTVIAIAHRLHTSRDADRVAVMEAGRITEIGGHDELVRHGGAYASLWATWNTPSARPSDVGVTLP